MKKIISIVISIIAVISVLLITVVNKLDTIEIGSPIYYFSFDKKVEYDNAKIKHYKEKSTLKSGKIEEELSAQPIYYENESKIFLPKDMAVINYETGQVNKVKHFSNIVRRNGENFVEYYGEEKILNKHFLYDGEDTYVFLETTNIKVGDQVLTLSPLSYVKLVNNGNDMEVYSKDEDTYVLVNGLEKELKAELISNYEINLKLDILKNSNGEQLLFKNIKQLVDY